MNSNYIADFLNALYICVFLCVCM